jgi:ABC-type transporter Mla subunit MlaD
VSISSPHGNSDAGPYLAPGATFPHAQSSDELGDLFAAATPLLNQIDTNQLSTFLGELAQASQGEGPKIAAGINAGTQLAGLLDRTLNAQILALDSFAKFTNALAPAAGDLNNLNAQINAGLPGFNAEEADYQNLINTLIPFSDRLASLLATYHPDIATILTSGDNVSRVLLAQQDNIGQVINGAYHYFQKIAEGTSGLNKLPDGSTYGYFNTFILFNDVNSLICNLIAPPTGGMSYLEPLQQALAGAGSAFNCSSQLSSFASLQGNSSTPSVVTPPNGTSPTSAANSAGSAAANQVYGIIGQPDTSKPTTLGGILNQLVGGPSS